MCGITGIVRFNSDVNSNYLSDMTNCLAHRGPDDAGVWISENKKVGFGHRRLSIIDLSSRGHQPMSSSDGCFSITFNGEIYNYKELKSELKGLGYKFKSDSDTEVLLYAYIQWKEDCLTKLNGMFAFAIWDQKKQKLFAARDRLGEKPFKYYFDENQFIFASEIKAILKNTEIKREVDWQAVDIAMTYRYVPSPMTGFKNIFKLPAGHKLVVENGNLDIKSYWQAQDFAQENHIASYEDLKIKTWDIFKDSVEKRMVSDVPVGAFLSGGLDSSSVIAAMAEVSSKRVRTFSVGFKDTKDSETLFAKLVADKYNTDHTEIMIDPDVLEILPGLIDQYEEPFFDNSAVPTIAMSKLTSEHVKVVLTGDGGDECFGGYPNHYFYKYLSGYHKLPDFFTSQLVSGSLGLISKILPHHKLKKLFYRSELLGHELIAAYVDYYAIWQKELQKSKFYETKKTLYTDKFKSLINIDMSDSLMEKWLGVNSLSDYSDINRSILADVASRLGDNYLVKVDMASMLYGLETRPPFLDHRLIELSLSIPAKYKIKGHNVKLIWKDIVKDKLPEQILKRKKMGFGIPIISWMRNELFEHLYEELVSSNHQIHQMFKKEIIKKILLDHKNGIADYSNHIWSIWLLKLWLNKFFAK